jgi:hypothetical protein
VLLFFIINKKIATFRGFYFSRGLLILFCKSFYFARGPYIFLGGLD